MIVGSDVQSVCGHSDADIYSQTTHSTTLICYKSIYYCVLATTCDVTYSGDNMYYVPASH